MSPRTHRPVRALHHPIRATIGQRLYTAERPVPLADLAAAFKLKTVVAYYHVRVLATCGMAVLEGEGDGLLVGTPPKTSGR